MKYINRVTVTRQLMFEERFLRCEHRKIFKVCLAIFQHYAIKG